MAVLLLIPPSEDPVTASGDTERYVANQLAVLSSTNLSERVATRLNGGDPDAVTDTDEDGTSIGDVAEPTSTTAGEDDASATGTEDETGGTDGSEDAVDEPAEETAAQDEPVEPPDVEYTPAEVKAAANFIHVPSTDIVQILAQHENPARARAIANGYLDQYLEDLEAQVAGLRGPDVANLEALRDQAETDLEVVDTEIETRMQEARETFGPDAALEPDSVVSGLVSQQTLLRNKLGQLDQALIEQDLQGQLQVASTEVQQGALPDAPVNSTSKILIAAGLVGGGFMGLLAAVLLARLSPRLLGPRHAEEILGQPLVGAMPGDPVLAGGPVAALGTLPPEVLEFVDLVSVRAEASSQSGTGSLVVAVIGSERGAGTTTLAAAMANRFASHGSEVLLVDADSRDRWLSRQLAPGAPGISELMELAPTLPNLRDKADPDLKQCLRPTAIPNLRVLGAGDTEAAALRRQNVSTIIAIASRTADVVVFDAGALMEASATVQLAHLADAVVLAIPDRQQAAALETVNRQLRGRRGALLAVWSGSARRDGDAGSRSAPPVDQRPDRDDYDAAEHDWQHRRKDFGDRASREVSGSRP
jgi:Mrp family chromosome partitioning ATPase